MAHKLIEIVERALVASLQNSTETVALPVGGSAGARESADIDLSVLDGLREVLGDELAQIVGLFLSQLDGQLQALGAAVEARDAFALAAQAHSLKGSSGNLGLRGIATLAAALEQAGRREDFDGVDQTLALLERVSAATRQALAELGYSAS